MPAYFVTDPLEKNGLSTPLRNLWRLWGTVLMTDSELSMLLDVDRKAEVERWAYFPNARAA
jgi:hypothetical protein